jgi:signal transduction histidine kinase
VMPAALVERGLAAAATDLADRVPLPVGLDLDPAVGRLPEAAESAAYFVIAEAVANAVKHARADRLLVTIRATGGELEVVVADDGAGGAVIERGSGLRGLADRVDALGGRLTVSSDGSGTTVAARIPLVRSPVEVACAS